MFEIGSSRIFTSKRCLIDIITGYDRDNLFLCEYFYLLSEYHPLRDISYNRLLFYTQPDVHVAGLKRWWEDVICSH